MPNFIAEEDTLRLLVAAERTPGVPNDLKDWFDFLLATQGPWKRVVANMRVNSLVNRQQALSLPSGNIYMSPDIDAGEIAIHSTIALINQFAGLSLYLDLVKYPVFVQMDATGYASETPLYLPNSEKPNTTQRTWDEWFDSNNEHRESPLGTYNIPLSSRNRGHDIALSMVARLKADGYTVKKMQQYPDAL